MHVTLLAAALPLVLLLSGRTTPADAYSTSVTPPFDKQSQKQHVPQILASIQDSLKSLNEALGSGQPHVLVSRPHVDLDALARRLEAVETRLGRIESSLDTRLNTLSENIGRRHGKEEMASDATNRKLESISERIFNKMGYLEAKIDEKFNKLSSRVETYPTEVQRVFKTEFPSSSSCCHQLTMSVTSGESRLRKEIQGVDQKVEEVRKSLRKFENINANDLIQSLSQNLMSFMSVGKDKFIEFFKTEVTALEARIRVISTDLWKRTVVIEEKVVETSTNISLACHKIQEILKKGPVQPASRHDPYSQSYAPQSYYSNPAPENPRHDRVVLKINQLGKDIDYNFKTLMDAQKQFRDGCRRIQEAEVSIERSIEGYLIRMHENFVNETINTKGLLEDFSRTDLQMSKKLQDIRNYLEQSSDLSTGNAKNIFTNLNLLREAMNHYFKEFTVETVASKVTEDLKPILLKFADDSVLAPSNFASHNDSIFQELEDIISLNKSNETELTQTILERNGTRFEEHKADDYGEEATTSPSEDYEVDEH